MLDLRDKTLLLLGILHTHAAHGYELHAILRMPGVPIAIGKANAYQILGRLEAQGWATHVEAREGRRPPRRVYSITDAGRAEFDRLLRERLADRVPADHSDAVSLNFLELLPSDEALALLRTRRECVQQRVEDLASVPDDVREHHPGIDYMVKQLAFESRWLDDLIRRLTKETNR